MSHKQKNPVLAVRKFLRLYNPHIWLFDSDCDPLYYNVWVVVEQETNETLCNTKDELKSRIMAAFTNLNKETIGKACREFKSCVETNGDLFE